jgi:transcription elongation factor Elf1
MSEPIRLGYPITFTCHKCKKNFHAIASVQQSENVVCALGLICYECANQKTLELDFNV